MTPAQRELLQELQTFAQSAPTAQALMERVCKRLHETMTRYNWVGVLPGRSGRCRIFDRRTIRRELYSQCAFYRQHGALRRGGYQRAGCGGR